MVIPSSALPPFARRAFLRGGVLGLGAAALAELLPAPAALAAPGVPGLPDLPHHAPRAKRVICLVQSGAPSQMDLFDYKPELERRHGEELPESIRRGQRLTTMTAEQGAKPLTASPFRFAQHGTCGAWVSELLPHTARIVDDLCFVRSLHTEAINHDPAITLLQTGSPQPGRPSLGAWLSYGLGAETAELPAFVVLISGGAPGDQPLYDRLWGAGFLPPVHQAVKLRPGGSPILFLADPPGVSRAARRRMLDAAARLERLAAEDGAADAERAEAAIARAEQAFHLQAAAPEAVDLADEPEETFRLYGEDARRPGTFAANCLLARRLAERGVRIVQLYHRDWDHHLRLPRRIREQCRQTDQPAAALVRDLKQRGLLEDTLVIWTGEFGRTAYCQGDLTADDFGRDHHPRCWTAWLAGGGAAAGRTHGTTDEFSYNVAADPVHVHDLQATVLHLLGIDHERLTFRSQGRDFRLTDVAGRVVEGLLA